MIFAQINTKGQVVEGTTEPKPQNNLIFRLDKVLDVAANGAIDFVIRLQDSGQASTNSVNVRILYPSGKEASNITTDQLAQVNENLIQIMNSVATTSYTDNVVDITSTILAGAVDAAGEQPVVFGATVEPTNPQLS